MVSWEGIPLGNERCFLLIVERGSGRLEKFVGIESTLSNLISDMMITLFEVLACLLHVPMIIAENHPERKLTQTP